MAIKENIDRLLENINDRALSNEQVDKLVHDILREIDIEESTQRAIPADSSDPKFEGIKTCSAELARNVCQACIGGGTPAAASTPKPAPSPAPAATPKEPVKPAATTEASQKLTTAVAEALHDIQSLTVMAQKCDTINIVRPELVICL